MPPGFMKAISVPRSACVAHSCASATRLPIVDSPPRFSEPSVWRARVMSPVISPTVRLPMTSAFATAASTMRCTAGSAGNAGFPSAVSSGTSSLEMEVSALVAGSTVSDRWPRFVP